MDEPRQGGMDGCCLPAAEEQEQKQSFGLGIDVCARTNLQGSVIKTKPALACLLGFISQLHSGGGGGNGEECLISFSGPSC